MLPSPPTSSVAPGRAAAARPGTGAALLGAFACLPVIAGWSHGAPLGAGSPEAAVSREPLRVGPRIQEGAPGRAGDGGGYGASDWPMVPTWSPPEAQAFRPGAILRTSYTHTIGTPEGESVRGFELFDVRLWMEGGWGRADFLVEAELGQGGTSAEPFEGGEPELLEAWGRFRLDERHRVRVGQVLRPILRSVLLQEDQLPLTQRTRLDQDTQNYGMGTILEGEYGFADVQLALQVADGSVAPPWIGTARVDLHLFGGGVPMEDEALGTARDFQWTFGVAYSDDGSVTEGDLLTLDTAMRFEGLGLFAEWADFGRDLGSRRPWSVTATGFVAPEELELVLRHEVLDDGASTAITSLGVTRYVAPGRFKLQGAVDRVRSDDGDLQGTRLRVITTLSF